MIARWAAFVLRHRLAAWAAVGLLVVIAGLGALRLRLDFSSTSFYGTDDPALARLETFTQRYGADDRTLIVVAQADDYVLGAPYAQPMFELADALEQMPEVESVTWAGSFGPLPPDLDSVPPPFMPALVARDGRATAMLVELESSTDDLLLTTQMVEAIEETIAAHEPPGLDLLPAGVPGVRAAFFALTLRDQMWLGPLSMLLIAGGLAFAFRRWHGVVLPIACAAVALIGLSGLMGWLGEPIGLLNQAYSTLIPVIAVSDAVHLVARTHELARERGESRPSSATVIDATGRIGRACALTSVTTAIGFASLAINDVPSLQRFGLYASAGIAIAFATAVTLGPLLLSHAGSVPAAPKRRLVTAAAFATRRPALAIGGMLAVALVAAALAPGVVVDNRLTDLLRPEHPVRRASEVVDDHLGGTLSVEVEVLLPERGFQPPPAISTFLEWAAAQSDFRVVGSPWFPLNGAYVAPPHARLSLRTRDDGGRAFAQLETRTRDALAVRGITGELTGTASLAYRGVNRMADNLRTSLLIVAASITFTIGFLFRGLGPALRSFVPNMWPLVVGYGSLAVIGVWLDPLAGIILAVGLGLAVDDTIHIMARYREELGAHSDARAAVEAAVASSGHAVVITSLCLAVGLGVNLLSSFPPLQLLGGLGAAVILLALMADLVLLPALLVLGRR